MSAAWRASTTCARLRSLKIRPGWPRLTGFALHGEVRQWSPVAIEGDPAGSSNGRIPLREHVIARLSVRCGGGPYAGIYSEQPRLHASCPTEALRPIEGDVGVPACGSERFSPSQSPALPTKLNRGRDEGPSELPVGDRSTSRYLASHIAKKSHSVAETPRRGEDGDSVGQRTFSQD